MRFEWGQLLLGSEVMCNFLVFQHGLLLDAKDLVFEGIDLLLRLTFISRLGRCLCGLTPSIYDVLAYLLLHDIHHANPVILLLLQNSLRSCRSCLERS